MKTPSFIKEIEVMNIWTAHFIKKNNIYSTRRQPPRWRLTSRHANYYNFEINRWSSQPSTTTIKAIKKGWYLEHHKKWWGRLKETPMFFTWSYRRARLFSGQLTPTRWWTSGQQQQKKNKTNKNNTRMHKGSRGPSCMAIDKNTAIKYIKYS